MWHNIFLDKKYIGETISKGTSYLVKDYTYIHIPDERYINYTFLLSTRCISEATTRKDAFMLSIADDMNIELFYHPDFRESGTRYKRYKMTGKELVEDILAPYEDNLLQDWIEREKKQKKERDRRNKRVIGNIVYGQYLGNIYNQDDKDIRSHYYFEHDGIFYRPPRQKVKNVKVEQVIFENVSKYLFDTCSPLLPDFLQKHRYVQSALRELQNISQRNIEEPLLSPHSQESLDKIIKELEQTEKLALQEAFDRLKSYASI